MRSPRQFPRSDAGYYDTRFTDPSGLGVTVDFDANLFIEFRDYGDTLRFTATATSTPPIQVGLDANGPFYYVVGLNLSDWAFGASKAAAYAYVNGQPFIDYPVIEEPAFTIVSDQIPIHLQRDENVHAVLKGTTRDLTLVIIDPITGYRSDADQVSLSVFDERDANVHTDVWPSAHTHIVKRDSGVFSIPFDTTVFKKPEYLLNVDIQVSTGTSFVRNKVIRVVPGTYFRYGAILRNQVDKANKLLHNRLQFGYTDDQLIVWLDLGAHLINLVPPYTAFDVMSFPFGTFGKVLLDAATISALESQGLFSIDTDFDYSLGGNSLTLNHYTTIAQFLDYLVGRLNDNLMKFKQIYRTKGGTMVQTQYGYGFGRFLSVVPPGFFSRFGLSVGPGVGSTGGASSGFP